MLRRNIKQGKRAQMGGLVLARWSGRVFPKKRHLNGVSKEVAFEERPERKEGGN